MIDKELTQKLKQEATEINPKSLKLMNDFLEQLNVFYSKEVEYEDEEIESLMGKHMENKPPTNFYTIPTFRASSVSHCALELYYINQGYSGTKRSDLLPYHRRWLRNAHAIHSAMQRDLLYMEKYLTEPTFTVAKRDGLPAWEETIRGYSVQEYNDQTFGIEGMMDGILKYGGKFVGFEFKTKSTTIGVIGRYKMKVPIEAHVEQLVAYSLLFDIKDFIIMYESLAKDGWNKGLDAKEDVRIFHVEVTEEMQNKLKNKLAAVSYSVINSIPPAPEFDKCLLCSMKDNCEHYAKEPNEEELSELSRLDLGGLIDG